MNHNDTLSKVVTQHNTKTKFIVIAFFFIVVSEKGEIKWRNYSSPLDMQIE